jgi:signal transduction histidine kinase
MWRPKSPSIAWELTAINMLVSAVALLLAAVALGAYDRSSFRDTAVQNLSIRGQILGASCASALLFNDQPAAEALLGVLSSAPNVISAEIYSANGTLFAAYRRDHDGRAPKKLALAAGQNEIKEFNADDIVVARPIILKGQTIGSVSISSDFRELNARRDRTLGIIMAVLAASFLVALLVSRLLQRSISGPIIGLSEIAKRVSSERDYSVRAVATGHNAEMGVMFDAFNDMLAQIERRDGELREVHEQLEERVRQRTEELDITNKELEAFSYSVSHDLRAPLRHVTGFAALLQQSTAATLAEKDRRYLTTISEAAQRMGRLIDDLLAFSRMGRTPLARRRVQLDALVDEARRDAVSAPGAPPIVWTVHPLPEVDADASMLQLALVNLLSNAVKYSSTQEHPEIEVGAAPGAPNETVVFVRDNGVGFDMKYVDKLFGVFQRLHSSDQFEGTGIGLANVRRIITRHGGRVWAESVVGHGAAFYFSLPTVKEGTT